MVKRKNTKAEIPRIILRHKGVFNQDKLFKMIYDWFLHQGFKVEETKYKHKIPTPKGAEQEISWSAEKKINSYIQFTVLLEFWFYDLKEVDIVREKEKKKMNSGKTRIHLSGNVVWDYDKRFGGNNFLIWLGNFFDKFIYKQDIGDVYSDMLYYRLYKLHRKIKEYLDMETDSNASEGRW